MRIFNTTQTLGEIVAIMPKASEVFKAYQIDFCCGGNRSLEAAIKEQNLDEQEILSKLDAVYEATKKLKNTVDFRNLSSSELIDYILNTHHSFAKQIVPSISEMTTKILRVHGSHHEELFQVHKLFHGLKTELEQHFIKEEEILFPLMKQYDTEPSKELFDKIKKTMKETEDEHDGAGDILKELRKITKDYVVPDDGCATYELAYKQLQELESDLFEHIHLENNILFKRFD
ncbi:MAG: iron-sulfur cluster repair di-iron protein [Epulopiscium sp.]|nr:iron-sulfur cluster repair di-iron protein [Candidatus Epulonipiscium sp.]